jgi:hypothetical protein
VSLPEPAALAAAYQVSARWFAGESQLIWRRTALFVALNTLIVAAVQYLKLIPEERLGWAVWLAAAAIGLIYSISWHFSMGRSWVYHDFLLGMMREQEEALGLGTLGSATRGRKISSGGHGDQVGGETIKFPPVVVLFRARVLANATTWLFAAVYAASVAVGFWKLAKPN